MSTLVNIQPNDFFGDLGSGFGSGFNKGVDISITKKAAADKARRLGALMNDIHAAGSKEAAVKLAADPRYSDLFKDTEELQSFGKLVDDAYKGEKPKQLDATVNGEKRSVFLPSDQVDKISRAPNQDEAFAAAIGADPNSTTHLGWDDKSEKPDMVDILDKAGRIVQTVKKGEFDKNPQQYTQNGQLQTKDEFDRAMKIANEERLKNTAAGDEKLRGLNTTLAEKRIALAEQKLKDKQAGKGEENKPTDAQRRAVGLLDIRGIPQTPENVNRAMAITDRTDKFAGRIAATFNMAQQGNSFVEKMQGNGDSEKFAVATAAMPNLMFSGLDESTAFKAAVTIGNAIPTKGMNLDTGEPEMKPGKVQVPEITAEIGNKLTDGDKGKVFKQGDKFVVFTGIHDNKPMFEVVTP